MIKDKNIDRRFWALGLFVVLMVGLIIFELAGKQIFDHAKYTAMAEGQQRFETTDLAQRGKIYVHDSIESPDGVYPLAFDVKKYSVYAIPKNITKKEEVAQKLSGIISLPAKDIFDQINNDKAYAPAIAKGLDYSVAQKIGAENITGLYTVPEYSRYYPENNLASQVLGFVNADGKGNYGFEGHYDKELLGTSGETTGEKDTLGRVISLLNQKDPKDGTSYILSIDRSVQYYVEQKLAAAITKYGAESGSVVIMDAKTGGIVAMASSPNFDPNTYKETAKSSPNLFVNPAIASLYEPGSIFKPIIMSAALDSGAVTPDTSSTFGASVDVQGFTIHTAEGKGFGLENMTQILQHSDNVGMVFVGQKTGKETINKYLSKFGFLDKTNIDLDSETAGTAPSLKNWQDITTATVSFGQGIAITPIELICGYGTIANKGKYLYPRMVDQMLMPNGDKKSLDKKEGDRVISEQTAKQVTDMMVAVTTSGYGKKAQVPGYLVAGKTGTAQIANPAGGYLDEANGNYIHSFAGFAPADDPRFVMLVKLDRPKTSTFAESTAAPVFGDIASYLLNFYYRVPPNQPIPSP